MVAAPFLGTLADRFGRRPIVLVSLGAYVLAFTGYLFATSAPFFILLRALAGVFTAGLVPAVNSIVGDLAPEDRRGRWIGIVNGGASAGWIAGPLVGGLLYDHFGYVVPFSTSIAMAFGALLIALLWIPESRAPVARSLHSLVAWKSEWRAVPARPTLVLLMLITLGVMFAWAFIEPQFMFYAYDDLHWTSSQLGVVMSSYGLAFMVGELGLGQLSDRAGRRGVLVMGLALFSAQFAGLVVFHQAIWIVVSFIIAGLGNALYDPALSAFILDITPEQHRAAILGIKSTAGSLGTLLGPALLVLFTPFAGPRIIFLLAAVLVLMLALASGLLLRLPARAEMRPGYSGGAAQR
jgi:DHA1 family multidrug resistance protein-like MFS transporter